VADFFDNVRPSVDSAISALAEARVIYGVRSLPPPWSLVADELDEHFNFDVRHAVERVNAYFKERLDAVLSAPE
jgi:type IV secretory pathway TrbF-like protein